MGVEKGLAQYALLKHAFQLFELKGL